MFGLLFIQSNMIVYLIKLIVILIGTLELNAINGSDVKRNLLTKKMKMLTHLVMQLVNE